MTWWRANRWWLPVLPLCVVAMLAASAYRVEQYWYDAGLHHELAAAAPGRSVGVTDDYSDARGRTSRSFRVRLVGITRSDRMPRDPFAVGPQSVPSGAQVLVADLDWTAAADQSLTGCVVALIDDRGRRYEPSRGLGRPELCVPARRTGPTPPVSASTPRGATDDPDDKPRPASWSTAVSVLAPRGVHITSVRIWWDLPDYVELPVG